jgi:hypothetical protein
MEVAGGPLLRVPVMGDFLQKEAGLEPVAANFPQGRVTHGSEGGRSTMGSRGGAWGRILVALAIVAVVVVAFGQVGQAGRLRALKKKVSRASHNVQQSVDRTRNRANDTLNDASVPLQQVVEKAGVVYRNAGSRQPGSTEPSTHDARIRSDSRKHHRPGAESTQAKQHSIRERPRRRADVPRLVRKGNNVVGELPPRVAAEILTRGNTSGLVFADGVGELASTGFNPLRLIAIALLLLAAGTSLVVWCVQSTRPRPLQRLHPRIGSA